MSATHTHQTEFKSPNSSGPELHKPFWLVRFGKIYLNAVPPAFSLYRFTYQNTKGYN